MSDDKMLAEHKRTYDGFMRGTLYSVIAIVVVLVLMAVFLL